MKEHLNYNQCIWKHIMNQMYFGIFGELLENHLLYVKKLRNGIHGMKMLMMMILLKKRNQINNYIVQIEQLIK